MEDENYLVECCIGYQQRPMTKFGRPFYPPKTGLVFCDMAGYKDKFEIIDSIPIPADLVIIVYAISRYTY